VLEETGAIIADWPAEVWPWSPHGGRWSTASGRPREPVFVSVSTQAIRPGEAYEFWCETALYHFAADAPARAVADCFTAQARGIIGTCSELYSYGSAAIAGARSRCQQRLDGGDNIDVGVVFSGRRYARDDQDQGSAATAGMLFCYDAARPGRVAWTRHAGAHLSLPRGAVETALGGPVPPTDMLQRALAASRLAPVLKDQFALVARHLERLAPAERGLLLEHTERLALATLTQALSAQSGRALGLQDNNLFEAAQHYIARHFNTPGLQVAKVAHALGCSRTALYRAFARRDCSVADMIRTRRLDHARQLLAKTASTTRIGDIAAHCGYADLRTFNRAFRARFGITPGQARERWSQAR